MEDLISREKAIEEIKAVFEWHDTVTMERMIEHFNNLPSAQPEKRTKNARKRMRAIVSADRRRLIIVTNLSTWSISRVAMR